MSKTEAEEAASKGGFKFRYVLMLAALLLFILALASHDAADLSILEGGSDEPLRNWIGPAGAQTARALLYFFGLATYPIAALLIVCIARSFMPFRMERKGYVGSLVAVIIGTTILMAMWPESFTQYTEKLGIGHRNAPELALSGGVIGSQLAAPETKYIPAGVIRRTIGTVGAMIFALCFLIPGIVFIILADWKHVVLYLFEAPAKIAGAMALEAKEEEARLKKKDGEEEDGLDYEDEDGRKRKIDGKQAKGKDEEDEDEDGKPIVAKVKIQRPGNEDEKGEDDEDEEKPAKPPLKPASKAAQDDDEEEEPPKPKKKDGLESLRPVPVLDAMHGIDKPEPKDKGARKAASHSPAASLENPDYTLPPISLLEKAKETQSEDQGHIEESQKTLEETLQSFNIDGRVSGIIIGPRVTRFEISLAPGVKVEKVTGITNNIAMDLKAESIRILAPVPGMDTVGVEVPNKVSTSVYLRQLMETSSWKEAKADIPIVLGRDVGGKAIIADLAKAPHLLIAGSTGSGKSVCMNTLIMSLLFKFPPSDLRLILVDPKHVELEMYRPLPHLITPVVNDPKKVPLALRWGVNEMEKRYKMLAKVKAKNLAAFNSRPPEPAPVLDEDGDQIPRKLPITIIIIDELADIMMTDAKSDVETSICRIAQKGRAAGIHLVIATQTPRKDIVTGVIKANLPTKIAFRVTSGIDSRVILDVNGAESLLGKGDMLFRPPGGDALERIQGAMVSDPEIQKVVDFVSGQVEQSFDHKVVAEQAEEGDEDEEGSDEPSGDGPSSEFADSVAAQYLHPGDGELLRKALEIIVMENKASTSYLQRRLGIGYNKSAELMDLLEKRGVVSAPLPGGQKREILVTDHLETKES